MFLPKEEIHARRVRLAQFRDGLHFSAAIAAHGRDGRQQRLLVLQGPGNYTVYLAEFCPQFVSVTASQDGTTRELLLWPPLRNIVYDEYGNLRLFWWSGAQPANETVLRFGVACRPGDCHRRLSIRMGRSLRCRQISGTATQTM